MDAICMLLTNPGWDDPRVCMEAEALAGKGHRVTVVGWQRDGGELAARTRRGVEFVPVNVRSTHGRGITQPVFLAAFWQRAWPLVQRLAPRVLHCHDLDTLPLGWRAARRLGAALVFDAHENYPDMMVGHLPQAAVKALAALERRLVPRCDVVITVGSRLAEHYRRLGAQSTAIVGNWKDPAEFRFPAEEISGVRRELGLGEDTIAVCFIAHLGRERRIEPFLKAVADDRRFAFVIGGEGSQAEMVQREAARSDNIIYLGRVQPDRVPAVTAACDVVYYGFDETNPNARWSAPNKLYEAIAARKPIVSGDFGEIGQTIRDFGCGFVLDLADPIRIRETLDKLACRQTRSALAANALKAGETFSRSKALSRLYEAYNSLGDAIRRPGAARPAMHEERPV